MAWRTEVWVAGIMFLLGSGPTVARQRPAAAQQPPPENKAAAPPAKHKLGPLEISVNWRARAEGWDWFSGGNGNSNYALGHSLLRMAAGQTSARFAWQVEAAQATLLGVPNNAIAPAPQGQLGLGGSYYTANGNRTNAAISSTSAAM